jgi:hypothetical protein
MRPNFPAQIAQRLAAPLQRCWGLSCIFASCGSCVGSDWCPPPGGRRISRTREGRLWDRSGLPDLAVYRGTVRRA